MTAPPPIEVGLGLGSNEGDRIAGLRAAKARLQAVDGVTVVAQSSLYETEPVGVKPEYQHLKFINAVLVLSITIPLADLHRLCLETEAAIGRRRTDDKFAPRPLDIDVLYAGDRVSTQPGLILPHPQCLKRRFVLEPLAEIRPDLVLAGTGRTVRDLLDALPNPEPVVRLPEVW